MKLVSGRSPSRLNAASGPLHKAAFICFSVLLGLPGRICRALSARALCLQAWQSNIESTESLMFRRSIRDEGEFVWKRRTSWSQHLVRLLIVAVAVGALAWVTLLPINELTTQRVVMPEPVSVTSAEDTVSQTVVHQSHSPAAAVMIPRQRSQALIDDRPDGVETSPSMSEARRPDPWVIRTR